MLPVSGEKHHISKPEWLRIKVPSGDRYSNIKQTISTLDLRTICQEARCPTTTECWGTGTATITIMDALVIADFAR